MLSWFRSFCVWRVSSQAIRSTSFRMRSARSVMSSRLPMGVPTMYRQPPPGADPFDGAEGRSWELCVARFLDTDRSLARARRRLRCAWYTFGFRTRKRRLSVPLYEYKCLKCGRKREKIENVDGPHLKKCPHCGGKVEALFSAPAIQFKGSGWYVTDYGGKKSSGDSGKEEKPATESKESAKESDGKESAAKDSGSKDSGTKDSGSKEKKSEKSKKK